MSLDLIWSSTGESLINTSSFRAYAICRIFEIPSHVGFFTILSLADTFLSGLKHMMHLSVSSRGFLWGGFPSIMVSAAQAQLPESRYNIHVQEAPEIRYNNNLKTFR